MRGQEGSLPEPLVGRAGAEPLGLGGVGDRLGRFAPGATSARARAARTSSRFLSVIRISQERGQSRPGQLGLAQPQLEEGAAVPGGRVAGIQASKASYSWRARSTAPDSASMLARFNRAAGVVARVVRRDHAVVLRPRRGEVSQLLVEIPQLEVDPSRFGPVAQLLEALFHVVERQVPASLRPIEPGPAEPDPRRFRLQRRGDAVMV